MTGWETPLPAHVRKVLIRWLARAEVDRAVFFAVMLRLWQMLSGLVTLLLIARNLSPDEQGFYFTIASLLALQSFIELGFYIVIVNVASHEWAQLRLGEDGTIEGNPQALSRLVSLGRLVARWYSVASVLFVAIVGIAGFAFLGQQEQTAVVWKEPWVAVVVLTGLLLWMLPFNALLEGCNQMAVINQFRLSQSVLSAVGVWVALVLGWGLWAVVIAQGITVLRDLYFLGIRYRNFFAPFLRPPAGARIHWRSEILPMQWRIALSGAVNYLAYSLFNPVMFAYYGAATAGQMGMTWQMTAGLQALALSWLQTKVPRFGMLIAQKDYAALDRLFFRASLISLVVIACAGAALWLATAALYAFGNALAQRMLEPLPTGLFVLGTFFMQISQCQSAYLRAHKREPIMVMSVTSSLAVGLLVWLLGSRLGPIGAGAGYLAVMVAAVVWETLIWLRCRAKWHAA